MDYDEPDVLRAYVLRNYRRLLTDAEFGRLRNEQEHDERAFHEWLRERARCRSADQPEPTWEPPQATPGYEDFVDRAVRRVLQAHDGTVVINRCPRCTRVLRTPQARICFWCGHSQRVL
jgi:hypothetical protein